jgi:endonuclease YncB( thermonuclease family)
VTHVPPCAEPARQPAAVKASIRALGAIALAGLFFAPATAAKAITITGPAEAIKPYSFTLDDYEVFLLGVDSVETKQTCTVSGKLWECWAAAQRQLATILSEGDVTCDSKVVAAAPKRMIALCTVNGEDIGQRYVGAGFGVTIPAETTRYEDAQATARDAHAGLWQGTFSPPSIWRSLPIRPQSTRPEFTGAPID